MKFTFEDKVQIYKERKRGFTLSQLHFKWNITRSKIVYIVRLVDRHGIDIFYAIFIMITLLNLKKQPSIEY